MFSHIKRFALKKSLKRGSRATKGNQRVKGINNTHNWFKLIVSSNPRILNKYKEFCETNKIMPGPIV